MLRRSIGTQSSLSYICQTLNRSPTTAFRRFLSSTAIMAQKSEWLAILPDHPNVLDKRMQVREQHINNMKVLSKTGDWTMGGATLDTPPKDGEPMSLNGSIMIAVAETKEEVMEKLRKDIYATSGVWNMDKVTIQPFKPAFRHAA